MKKKPDVETKKPNRKSFHLEFKNASQQMAWAILEQHDIVFLMGVAGSGKTHLAAAYAISEILSKTKKKLILTRPVVEAGESLGFLPGTLEEKVNPYIIPVYDCMERIVGLNTLEAERISRSIELSPIAFLRGKTFNDAVCLLDEAQNCTKAQLKLFLTRLGENSKIIITGDPQQSDLRDSGFIEVIEKLRGVKGIGMLEFDAKDIVRHPLVAAILEKI